jgi:hypothetical protein
LEKDIKGGGYRLRCATDIELVQREEKVVQSPTPHYTVVAENKKRREDAEPPSKSPRSRGTRESDKRAYRRAVRAPPYDQFSDKEGDT